MDNDDEIKPDVDNDHDVLANSATPQSEEIDSVAELVRWEAEDKARTFRERGDYGYSPGNKKFPQLFGDSPNALMHRLIMGNSFDQMNQNDSHLNEKRKLETAKIYFYKVRNPKKVAKMKRLTARIHNITEVTINDPDILPRNITADEFINLYSAVSFANYKGAYFNTHLTINWRDLGLVVGDHNEFSLYDLFTKQYALWCTRNKIQCYWIYSNESSDYVGLHTHFLTAIPEKLRPAFIKFVELRLKRINISDVFLESAYKISDADSDETFMQWHRLQYLCKGIEQNALRMHANGRESVFVHDLIKFGYESPGDVTCKIRCGLSENLRKKVREKEGFISLMEQNLFNVDLLYYKTLPERKLTHRERKLTPEERQRVLNQLAI